MPAEENRTQSPTTATLVPDDEDFRVLVARGEESLLLELATAEDEEQYGEQPWQLPKPIANQVALKAYHRIQDVLDKHRRRPRSRLLSPDGRYEHVPLLLVELPAEDLEVIDGVLQALNRALAGDEQDLAELLRDIAGAWGMTAAELVGDFSRVVAVLALAPDEDTRQLTRRLAATAPGADVVLTVAEEAAYQRVANRLNLLLAAADPLDRFKY